MSPKLPNALPCPDRAWLDRVRRALDRWESIGTEPTSSILGTGAIEALERHMAKRIGVGYALALPSATIALRVALDAIGVAPGDEVIVPAYDWTAAVAATTSLGAVPVTADISLPACAIDPAAVLEAVTPATRAVVVTHLFGVPADVAKIRAVCDPLGIAVVEDCAQAFGAEIDERPVGSLGAAAVFSFGRGKLVDAGEGGMMVTGSEALWRRAVERSQHPGRQRLSGVATPVPAGLATRMHPLAAILALDGLQAADAAVDKRRRRCAKLYDMLSEVAGVMVPAELDRRACTGEAVPVGFEPGATGALVRARIEVEVARPAYTPLIGPEFGTRERPAPHAVRANAYVRCVSLAGDSMRPQREVCRKGEVLRAADG